MKRVRCDSGCMGWQCRLRDNYTDFAEFKWFAHMYNIHKRLGYRSMVAAWRDNPVVQGSVLPSDFRRVEP